MLKHIFNIILFSGFIPLICSGQETDTGPGYQMIMANNPGYSGAEGEGVLRLSYLNFYPGNNYNFHYVYASYDSYFTPLHGGAGIWLSDDYMGGIVNDFRGGLSYAYFLQAGKNLFINAGLSASVYHRGYNFEGAVLPDQIDPLGGVSLPSAETLTSYGKTVFDVGAGFIFIAGNASGGLAINHLAEPQLSIGNDINGRLRRKLDMNLSYDISLNKSRDLEIRPLGFFELEGTFVTTAAGAVLESKYLSVNALIQSYSQKELNGQAGFSIKAGRVSIYYNYRFNISSENNLVPLSLLHQTGLIFSLNNVEKRNIIKTINFPKL